MTLPDFRNRGPFVGRETEFGKLEEALAGRGLVSIVGPGGVGKTRLAVEYSSAAEDVVAVWLDEIRTDDEVPARVTSALGLQPGGGGDVDRISQALRDREDILLLLDNAEHVIDGVRDLLRQLPLDIARVLVTSRVALELPVERRVRLGSLTPDDASRLLEVRGAMLDVDVSIDAGAELLEALDHLPLAIELAAARMTILTPEQILARLQESNAVLGSSDPSRHGALDRTIAWSWEHLDDDERRLLVPLAEFDHPLAPAFVEELWPDLDVWTLAQSLESKSWIQVVTVGDEKRWVTLRVIRRFLNQTLDAELIDHARSRIVDWAGEHVTESAGWWASYTPEALRAIELLAEEQNYEVAARLCGLAFYGAFGGPHFKAYLRKAAEVLRAWDCDVDARTWSFLAAQLAKGAFRIDVGIDPLYWSRRAYESAPPGSAERLRAGGQYVLCLLDAGRRDEGNETLDALVELGESLPQEMPVASPFLDLATAAHEMGRFDVARDTCLKVLNIGRHAEHVDSQARAWIHLSYVSYDVGEYERAAEEIAQLGHLMDQRHPHERLSLGGAVPPLVDLQMGRDDRARRSLEERMRVAEEIEYHGLQFFLNLAWAKWAARNAPEKVETYLQRSLALASRVASHKSIAHARFLIAVNQIHRGEYADALRILEGLREARTPANPEHWNDALAAVTWICTSRLGGDEPAPDSDYGALFESVLQSAHALDPTPMQELLAARAPATWAVPGLYFLRLDDVGRRLYASLTRESDSKRLLLQRDGRKMQFAGEPVQDLARRGPLRRILVRLAEHQQAQPGVPLTAEDVIEAGWPDEKILHDAALTRVYTTMNRLRSLGFEPWLETLDEGYALTSKLVVEWVDRLD